MTNKPYLGGKLLKKSSRLTRKWAVRISHQFGAGYDADDSEAFLKQRCSSSSYSKLLSALILWLHIILGSWTKPQVQARSHPNVLAATVWLNNLYHTASGETIEGVDLSTPLTYADRFRIRLPGTKWYMFPPHVDSRSFSSSECSI